jgi:hypothetical protein
MNIKLLIFRAIWLFSTKKRTRHNGRSIIYCSLPAWFLGKDEFSIIDCSKKLLLIFLSSDLSDAEIPAYAYAEHVKAMKELKHSPPSRPSMPFHHTTLRLSH